MQFPPIKTLFPIAIESTATRALFDIPVLSPIVIAALFFANKIVFTSPPIGLVSLQEVIDTFSPIVIVPVPLTNNVPCVDSPFPQLIFLNLSVKRLMT